MEFCFITGNPATLKSLNEYDAVLYTVALGNMSWRYAVSNDVVKSYSNNPFPDKLSLGAMDRVKIMNRIVSLNDTKVIPLFVWDRKLNEEAAPYKFEEIEILRNSEIDHKYKEDLLLKLMSKKLKNNPPFSNTGFNRLDLYRLNIFDEMELLTWLGSLSSKGFIEFAKPYAYSNFVPMGAGDYIEEALIAYKENLLSPDLVKLTSRGWEKVYNDSIPSESRNAFVAMAFTDNDRKDVSIELRDTIKKTCEELGWNALVVDEVYHNDGVMDKIISLINESRFVVADLTYHKSGVYYEAGYAKAKGLEVIHCVNKAEFSKCHFDVQHLNLIIWENYIDLEKKLSNRIKATVGKYVEQKH